MQPSQSILNLAISYACLSNVIKYTNSSSTSGRHGAIILSKGKPIGAGYSRRGKVLNRQFKQECSNYYSLHAEVSACFDAKGKGDSILVVRINKDNKSLMNSRPCIKCMNFLKNYTSIKWIHYSNKDGKIITERIR